MASAATMKSAFQSRMAVSSRVARPARTSVAVRASQESVDRRAVLGLLATAFGASLVAPQQASAMKLPWQESTGGMLAGGGSSPKSATAASMEGYTLEGFPGTKKPSFIEPSKKRSLRSKAREEALKKATSQ